MAKFNKYQKFSFIICALPFLGVLVAQLTKEYRYSEFTYIYLIGVLVVYLSWGISFIWGLINSLFILFLPDKKPLFKSIWILVSLLPILSISAVMLSVIINDPLEDDIVLPDGEHISGECRKKNHNDTIR